jgi:hypothetical protein
MSNPTPVTIKCPHCGQPVELTDALAHDMRERVLQEELPKLQARETALITKEQVLLQRESSVESLVLSRLAEEKKTLLPQLREEAKQESQIELSDLRAQLTSRSKELADVKRRELELLNEKTQFESDKANLDLTIQRRVNEERELIRKQVADTLEDAHKLDALKKEQQINDLREQIDVLKRKSEQGSQQAQGEVLENELEEILRTTFSTDTIEAVKTGARGADIKHTIRNTFAQNCGLILWESKSTANWQKTWIPKLISDGQDAKADVCVIVTTALPDGISHFGIVDGIWVTSYSCFVGVAQMLRHGMLSIAKSKTAESRRQDVQTQLYNYLISNEFRNRMESILRPFLTMKSDLETEIKTTKTRWSKRQKQLDLVIEGVTGFSGDLEGVIGDQFKQLPSLDFALLPEAEEEVSE